MDIGTLTAALVALATALGALVAAIQAYLSARNAHVEAQAAHSAIVGGRRATDSTSARPSSPQHLQSPDQGDVTGSAKGS